MTPHNDDLALLAVSRRLAEYEARRDKLNAIAWLGYALIALVFLAGVVAWRVME